VTKTVIVVDSNILLHFRSLEEWPWGELFGEAPIEIVVPTIVMREVDSKKYEARTEKLRKRATSVTRRLASHGEGKLMRLPPGVELRVASREPSISYEEYGLTAANQDDQVVATMIELARGLVDGRVLLVSNDSGIRVKARAHGFDVFIPQESLALPVPLDGAEKRVAELERELAVLKFSEADLVLEVNGGGDGVAFTVRVKSTATDSDVDAVVAACAERHPKQTAPPEPHVDDDTLDLLGPLAKIDAARDILTAPDYDRYNREIEYYLEDYRDFVVEHDEYQRRVLRTVEIVPTLTNRGGSPADDVDVWLTSPAHVRILSDAPAEPEPPDAPSRPMSMLERSEQKRYEAIVAHVTPPAANHDSDEILRWRVAEDGRQARLSVDRLKHGFSMALPPIYAEISAAKVASFAIEYTLAAANVVKHAVGHIPVRVTVSE
jgi:hypothetical protein